MEYAIETFSLTKIFSDWWGRQKVYAVDDLNLKIHVNEVFGLLGPNGSGKTTTLKMLLGLLYPTKGRSLLLGGDSTDPKISSRIGFLPEESYLYKYLTARETLDFYGRLFTLSSKVRKSRIETLLDMVGLKAVANRPVGTFSKGMARRIGLAQALINDPDLLILDEPTTGLDPIGTKQIKDLIIQLAQRGKTILLCSHLLADVEDVCDRIAILYDGKIQAKGRVKDLLEQNHKRQITTDYISDSAIEKIREIIKSENSQFTISSPMEKLETFFIKTVTAAQQQQTRPPSGAFSTTRIGDFLAAKGGEENVLDKLVSSVSSETAEEKREQREDTERVETVPSEPDQELLSKLTEKAASAEAVEVIKTETVEAEDVQKEKERTGKSILDQLTDSPEKSSTETRQDDGEAGDA